MEGEGRGGKRAGRGGEEGGGKTLSSPPLPCPSLPPYDLQTSSSIRFAEILIRHLGAELQAIHRPSSPSWSCSGLILTVSLAVALLNASNHFTNSAYCSGSGWGSSSAMESRGQFQLLVSTLQEQAKVLFTIHSVCITCYLYVQVYNCTRQAFGYGACPVV